MACCSNMLFCKMCRALCVVAGNLRKEYGRVKSALDLVWRVVLPAVRMLSLDMTLPKSLAV
jgi:hypothetical protein